MEEELRKLQPQRPQPRHDFEPRSRRGLIGDPRVTVIPEGRGPGDSEESDSDGPILYRDDEEDEEDEEGPPSMLFGTNLSNTRDNVEVYAQQQQQYLCCLRPFGPIKGDSGSTFCSVSTWA